MNAIRVESEHDVRLSGFRNVPDAELLSRLGLFVAEGRMVVRRLLQSDLVTRAVLATEPALAALDALTVTQSFPVYVVPQAVMNCVTGFNFHRGCLAIGVRPRARDWRDIVDASAPIAGLEGGVSHGSPGGARSGRLVALERVGNVDNIGSIFRNAAAFGVDGVLLQADCADPLYRKAIRTSMASTLTLPYARVPWPGALQELRARGWATIAMTPASDAPGLREVATALTDHPAAIVLGHEGEGLTREAVAACTHRARITMANGVDSLNVAAASAIALYELGRV